MASLSSAQDQAIDCRISMLYDAARSQPNINPTDEANAPLIYAAIIAKCSRRRTALKIDVGTSRSALNFGGKIAATKTLNFHTQKYMKINDRQVEILCLSIALFLRYR